MKWGTAEASRRKFLKKWDNGSLIRDLVEKSMTFPFRIPLKMPSSGEMVFSFNEVRLWAGDLEDRSLSASWSLERKEVNHRELGRNRIPSALVFQDKHDLLVFLGKKREFEDYFRYFERLIMSFPALKEWALQKPHSLLKYGPELERLIRIINWIKEHPRPGIYLRQLSLDEIDTKYIEHRRGLLTVWLDSVLESSAVNDAARGVRNFERRYGFLQRPDLIRFRYLDPDVSLKGFTDLTVRADEFCRLEPEIGTVFVVENDISALAFPPVSNALVLFGRGYHFEPLADAVWLQNKNIYYWGDLDSHGFAILAQFRKLFPNTQSILMDRATLLSHKAHWTKEKSAVPTVPAGLTGDEKALMKDLIENRYGENIRLEQEFILYFRLQECLDSLG